jgi:hypothetical protein
MFATKSNGFSVIAETGVPHSVELGGSVYCRKPTPMGLYSLSLIKVPSLANPFAIVRLSQLMDYTFLD